MGRNRPWGRGVVFGITATGLTVLSACAGPYQYYTGTGLHDATAAEAAGNWANIEDTQLTLRRDGTALFRQLDGQDFDFDDGWRVSGTGTWELTDDAGGQDIHLTMTSRTAFDTRAPAAAADTPVSTPPPTTYTWNFYVRRDQREALELFFMYGDPDIGNTYVMTRTTSTAAG